jgi:hypothetical protein
LETECGLAVVWLPERLMAAGCGETVVEFIECKEISVSGWLAQALKDGLRRHWLANGS